MSSDDEPKISQTGLVARSPEGHAARGMQIKGNEDVWIEIQAHTFRNWVNEKLAATGLQVEDLAADLRDGVRLVSLMEVLQKRKLRKVSRPLNQHHCLENVSVALKAIEEDGIRLVNIGNVDIVNGNQKLILGLIWSLIMKYQIGQSKFPPKKLMLSWLQTSLPDCNVGNFTTDWNSGVNLNALVNFCKPGLAPNWQHLDPNKGVENNRRAMALAKKHFGIPMVLEPEYLASPYVDELSGMTYLSYFMNKDGPGYRSTLDWVRDQLPEECIDNFTSDWNDGTKINSLALKYGAKLPETRKLSRHSTDWEDNWQRAIDGGYRLGVAAPWLNARDLADPEVDYIGPMAYVSSFRWMPQRQATPPPPPAPAQLPPRPATLPEPLPPQVRVVCGSRVGRVGQTYEFRVEFDGSLNPDNIRLEVRGPDSRTVHPDTRTTDGLIRGSFVPDSMGMHQVHVHYKSEAVQDSPGLVRVLPMPDKAPPGSGIDPCSVGSTVEVVINPSEASDGRIQVTAYSPWHRPLNCPVSCTDGVYTAAFQPDQVGEWKIHITYEGQHIQGSPFSCFVFDPNAVRVGELEGQGPGSAFTFLLDGRDAGWGDVRADIVWEGRSLVHRLTEVEKDMYQVSVVLPQYGKYRVYIYFNGIELRDNPFKLRVDKAGNHSISKRTVNGTTPTRLRDSASLLRDSSSHLRDSSSHLRESSSHLRESSSHLRDSSSHLRSSSPLLTRRSAAGDQDRVVWTESVDAGDPRFQTSGRRTNAYRNQSPIVEADDEHHVINRFHSSVVEESETRKIRSGTPRRCSSPPVDLHGIHRTSSPRLQPAGFSSSALSASRGRSPSRVGEIGTGRTAERHISSSFHNGDNSGIRRTPSPENPIYGRHDTRRTSRSPRPPINTSARRVRDRSADRESPSSPRFSERLSARRSPSPPPMYTSSLSTRVGGGRPADRVSPSPMNSTSTSSLTRRTERKTEERIYTSQRSHSPTPPRSTSLSRHVEEVRRSFSPPPIHTSSLERPARDSSVDQRVFGNSTPQFDDLGRTERDSPGRFKFSSTLTKNTRVRKLPTPTSQEDRTYRVRRTPSPSPTRRTFHDRMSSPVGDSRRRTTSPDGPLPAAKSSFVSSEQHHLTTSSTLPNRRRHHSPPAYRNTSRYRPRLDELPAASGDEVDPVSVPAARVPSDGHQLQQLSPPQNYERLRMLFDDCSSHTRREVSESSWLGLRVTRHIRRTAEGEEVVREVEERLDTHGHPCELVAERYSVCQPGYEATSFHSHKRTIVKEHREYRINDTIDGQLAVEELHNSSSSDRRRHGSFSDGNTDEWTPPDFRSRRMTSPDHFDYDKDAHIKHIIQTARPNFDPSSSERIRVPRTDKELVESGVRHLSDSGVRQQSPAASSSWGRRDVTKASSELHSSTATQHHSSSSVQRRSSLTRRQEERGATSTEEGGDESSVLPPRDRGRMEAEDEADAGSLRRSAVKRHPSFSREICVADESLQSVSVDCPVKFNFSAPPDVRLDDVTARVTDGSERDVDCWLKSCGSDITVNFTPREAGDHDVHVCVRRQPVKGSPFHVPVFNAAQIRVDSIPDGRVGHPVEFNIDGSRAGAGNLEILVNGGHVSSFVRDLGDQRFVASFVPHQPLTHTVEMTFNQITVPGSPWEVRVSGMESPSGLSATADHLRHFSSAGPVSFDISASGYKLPDVSVEVIGPSKRPVRSTVTDKSAGMFSCEFSASDVGSHTISVNVDGKPVPGSPFTCKAYNAGLIRVSDVPTGVVGQTCQFRVDASQAGEGQLEISINDGEVPNHVQVLGGGRCLVTFTPEVAKTHTIEIKFNGEPVAGCPFVCRVQPSSRVAVNLRHLELVPVHQPARFLINIDGGGNAELAVSVRGPAHSTLPVKVTGNVRAGFTAEFTPHQLGAHTILVEYNGAPVSGTPFTSKAYDAAKVTVTDIPAGSIGKPLQFTVDASEAGEGNLEISIGAGGRNIPTQVHPQGSARFGVSFVPLEPVDHTINISFNKEAIPGSPLMASVQSDPNHIVVKGASLASTAVGKPSFFTLSNVSGNIEDVEVNVDGRYNSPKVH